MGRLGRIARRRPWYRKAIRMYLRRAILVVVVMLLLAAVPFYRMLTTIPEDDHFPPKTMTELLDALESQIVHPD